MKFIIELDTDSKVNPCKVSMPSIGFVSPVYDLKIMTPDGGTIRLYSDETFPIARKRIYKEKIEAAL